jgi:hypothetical protein
VQDAITNVVRHARAARCRVRVHVGAIALERISDDGGSGDAGQGLGFGMYAAIDFALVADVLPNKDNVAKDLAIFNIAGALPFSIAPARAPAILAIEAAATACFTP